jgi:hypothetical protein
MRTPSRELTGGTGVPPVFRRDSGSSRITGFQPVRTFNF